MVVTIDIPDGVAEQMAASGKELSRTALEGLALEGYRSRTLSQEALRRLLGFETSLEVHAFLAEHEVDLNYSMQDWEDDKRAADAQFAQFQATAAVER